MHSTKRLWTPEPRARKHLKLGPNTILAIMRPGCTILTGTISRSFIKAESNFMALLHHENKRRQSRRGLPEGTGSRGHAVQADEGEEAPMWSFAERTSNAAS